MTVENRITENCTPGFKKASSLIRPAMVLYSNWISVVNTERKKKYQSLLHGILKHKKSTHWIGMDMPKRYQQYVLTWQTTERRINHITLLTLYMCMYVQTAVRYIMSSLLIENELIIPLKIKIGKHIYSTIKRRKTAWKSNIHNFALCNQWILTGIKPWRKFWQLWPLPTTKHLEI